ncbi:MAG: ATP-binding protein [Pseudomonadota bacterium]
MKQQEGGSSLPGSTLVPFAPLRSRVIFNDLARLATVTLFATWGLFTRYDQPMLMLVMAGLVSLAVLFLLLQWRRPVPTWLAAGIAVTDVLGIAVVTHLLGSQTSQLAVFFIVLVATHALIAGWRVGLVAYLASVTCYGATLWLEHIGTLTYAPLVDPLTRHSHKSHFSAAMIIGTALTALAVFLTLTLRWLEREQRAALRMQQDSEQARERALALERQLTTAHRLEAVGRLAGGVAHDFNNLLTLILGYARHVQRALPADSAGRSDLDEVVQAAKRASGLTQQLLAFSRRQRGERIPMDLNAAVQGLVRTLGRVLGEDIHLEPRWCEGLLRIHADPAQIDQVLLHLSLNARDAMPHGGRLVIETRRHSTVPPDLDAPGLRPGPLAELRVQDSGVGMDKATLEHIFEPFFTSKKRAQGTGLGLSTVYGIVEQMGGAVRVQSSPGAGAEFRVLLPLLEEDLAREETPAAGIEVDSLRGREQVLVVEDDAKVLLLVTEVLRSQGYQVSTAANAEDALHLVAAQPRVLDLLLVDVVLPGLSGPVLAEQLRVRQGSLRVLFMSGHDGDLLAQRGLADEEQELLHKPFSEYELLRRVRRSLDRAMPAAGEERA